MFKFQRDIEDLIIGMDSLSNQLVQLDESIRQSNKALMNETLANKKKLNEMSENFEEVSNLLGYLNSFMQTISKLSEKEQEKKIEELQDSVDL